MSRYDELAERYGTPLYVYDLDRVEAARADLLDALPEPFSLFSAVKANPHPEVLRALATGGDRVCRAEISSTGELAAALEAGFDPAECLYTGPGKTAGELAAALAAGVRLFSVESLTDLEHVGAAARAQGVVAECLVRINSASASATTSIRMTGTPSQFGVDAETLGEVLPKLRAVPGTEVVGAHFFPLSNAKDEDSLVGEFRHTLALAAELGREHGLPLRFLDIGGGFAAPYAVPGERPVYEKLRERLEDALDELFPDWRRGTPHLACESGRYLVGDSGVLLTRVVNIKESRGRTFVILDAGINTFGGMSGLGRLLPVAVQPADAGQAAELAHGEGLSASLVGPLCTPGDVLGRRVELPRVEVGDVLAIPNAGAYGPTASLLMFLGRPAPAEVLVRGGEVVSASRLEHRRTPLAPVPEGAVDAVPGGGGAA
ncbi:type III PLP-dependent enzyme [Streptomyces mobaraensis NBRC 13819 = DSM 40847]|uniref:Decarboxylase n=1 Tax=Streptomyces mobaraensis (strain ATCC 29032 / DSM 40847 / JCM 4168 / NBRC 13819 / NCIMB 11159 / IPCR 16-22) TaxID=1223523 RepID=M2ZXU4_STRM1|nr:decarboxylase [Streptomyces mobaraensis]EME97583.1 decarboxylase [Streptomyces mobaraensis NBRC 13819 = DSM 40847]QTT77402.1 type III PLP-dependent enzyme [Streptomyces mobaraensis NBRC 13819 = DSM 40847]